MGDFETVNPLRVNHETQTTTAGRYKLALSFTNANAISAGLCY